jgi:hypothetical protein
MENLTESVFECNFAVEAHMICDLLARAGISARVDGEFLSGAGGELPVGSNIKVRVDPSRATEARAVIDEWERAQPAEPATPAPPPRRAAWRSPLWFLCGLLVGGGLMVFALRTPYTSNFADLDGDGIKDETYAYSGQTLQSIEYDRNADRKVDARWEHGLDGSPKRYLSDDDFDGRFEWTGEAERGQIKRNVMDADENGRPEQVILARHGVVHTIEIYDEGGKHPVVREHYQNSRLMRSEFDKDGDGVFERRVEFDRYGEPLTR